MVSSVASRPNHYEVLGLAATASEGEVARAFAARMSPFGSHAPGEAARICAAYETLRNAAKRRDYDRILTGAAGVVDDDVDAPEALNRLLDEALHVAGFRRIGADDEPCRGTRRPSRRRSRAAGHRAAAGTIARGRARLGHCRFAAPAGGAGRDRPIQRTCERAGQAWPVPKPDPLPEMDIYRILERRAEPRNARDDEQPFEWRRPALVVGGLIAAAGLIGAFAGFSVKDDAASAAAPAVTVPLPAVKQPAEAAAAPVAPPVESTALTAAPARPKPSAAHSRFAPAVAGEVGDTAVQTQGIELASAEAPEAAEAQPVAASLPLPDTVVARTIERIGYSCGKVTGAVAGGSPGVYQVTCSSGDTYQATPVHGRYRFRRSR